MLSIQLVEVVATEVSVRPAMAEQAPRGGRIWARGNAVGRLTLPLEAIARQLGELSAGDQRPVTLAASRARVPDRGGDTVSAPLQLAAILALHLEEFTLDGRLLEVRVPWHTETLWFVPDERDAAALGREGVGRGRVWTARELADLMARSRTER